MDVTKSYKFIGFGAMDVTKPYTCIGFGGGRLSIGLPAARDRSAHRSDPAFLRRAWGLACSEDEGKTEASVTTLV